MRTFAIGDVHGHLTAFNALLDAIAPSTDDQIILLGDLVDRGPDAKGVIERAIALEAQTKLVAILGNHEEFMLEARGSLEACQYWMRVGGKATLLSYGGEIEAIPDIALEALRARALVQIQEAAALDRAGLTLPLQRQEDAPGSETRGSSPTLPSDSQPNAKPGSIPQRRTLAELLREAILKTPFDPSVLHIPETHLAFVARMRPFLETSTHIFAHATPNPTLPMTQQSSLDLRLTKWFDPQRHSSSKLLVCGHSAMVDGLPVYNGHAICIDTYIYGGQWLTGLEVETGRILQADATGKIRELTLESCRKERSTFLFR